MIVMTKLLSSPTVAGSLILQARLRAHLSQRDLAARADTSQAAIAAYERGTKDPAYATLSRILRAAGFDVRLRLVPRDDHDESLLEWRKSLPAATRKRFQHHQEEAVRRAKDALGFK